MKYEVLVEVSLRPGIADPQGATVERALPALGVRGVGQVRIGKAVRLTVEAADEPGARAVADAVADRLLANPVIERSTVTVVGPQRDDDDGAGGHPTGARNGSGP